MKVKALKSFRYPDARGEKWLPAEANTEPDIPADQIDSLVKQGLVAKPKAKGG